MRFLLLVAIFAGSAANSTPYAEKAVYFERQSGMPALSENVDYFVTVRCRSKAFGSSDGQMNREQFAAHVVSFLGLNGLGRINRSGPTTTRLVETLKLEFQTGDNAKPFEIILSNLDNRDPKNPAFETNDACPDKIYYPRGAKISASLEWILSDETENDPRWNAFKAFFSSAGSFLAGIQLISRKPLAPQVEENRAQAFGIIDGLRELAKANESTQTVKAAGTLREGVTTLHTNFSVVTIEVRPMPNGFLAGPSDVSFSSDWQQFKGAEFSEFNVHRAMENSEVAETCGQKRTALLDTGLSDVDVYFIHSAMAHSLGLSEIQKIYCVGAHDLIALAGFGVPDAYEAQIVDADTVKDFLENNPDAAPDTVYDGLGNQARIADFFSTFDTIVTRRAAGKPVYGGTKNLLNSSFYSRVQIQDITDDSRFADAAALGDTEFLLSPWALVSLLDKINHERFSIAPSAIQENGALGTVRACGISSSTAPESFIAANLERSSSLPFSATGGLCFAAFFNDDGLISKLVVADTP